MSSFLSTCLKELSPQSPCPWEDSPHPPREGALPFVTAPRAGASAAVPSAPQCPRPEVLPPVSPRRRAPSPHSAASQTPSTARSPWRRGAPSLPPPRRLRLALTRLCRPAPLRHICCHPATPPNAARPSPWQRASRPWGSPAPPPRHGGGADGPSWGQPARGEPAPRAASRAHPARREPFPRAPARGQPERQAASAPILAQPCGRRGDGGRGVRGAAPAARPSRSTGSLPHGRARPAPPRLPRPLFTGAARMGMEGAFSAPWWLPVTSAIAVTAPRRTGLCR